MLAAALMTSVLAVAAAAAPSAPSGVVIIVVDALRADAVDGGSMPRLKAFSAGAAAFERAYSAANWTLPAVASLMTGLDVPSHGAMRLPESADWEGQVQRRDYRPAPGGRLGPGPVTLAELLVRRGWRAEAYTSGAFCLREFGLGRGFQAHKDHYARSDELSADVRAALAVSPDKPFFLYAHLLDAHAPYGESVEGSTAALRVLRRVRDASPEAAERVRALYADAAAKADGAVGDLLDAVLSSPRGRDALIIVTADHGESLGERGSYTHGFSPYAPELRIPLIIRLPGAPPAVIRHPAETVDVLPTVLEALGTSAPAGLPGRSLLPLLRGKRGADKGLLAVTADLPRPDAAAVWRTERWTLVRRGESAELYDAAADPEETTDVAAREPGTVRRLRAALERRLAAARRRAGSSPPWTPEETALEALRAAGYLD